MPNTYQIKWPKSGTLNDFLLQKIRRRNRINEHEEEENVEVEVEEEELIKEQRSFLFHQASVVFLALRLWTNVKDSTVQIPVTDHRPMIYNSRIYSGTV